MTIHTYINTIDTIYPDGFVRERVFREQGDMVSPSVAIAPTGIWTRWIDRCREWRMKRAGRLVLRDLTDEQLRDIGITRWEMREEVRKSSFLGSV